MASPIHVLYFGDQSAEPYASIVDLLQEARASHAVPLFLRSTFQILQNAVATLPHAERSLFLGRDFAQLVSHVQDQGIRHAAVASVCSCVAQLGWTVLHRERNPELWSEHVDRVAVGVCTGTLSAIAAVAALSDTDFLRLASELVTISLRLGLEISHRSVALEASRDSWSAAVSKAPLDVVEKELRHFHESRDIPTLKRVYISARSSSSLTLSGPPTFLQAFLASDSFRAARKLTLPIFGLFHAAHLPLPEIDQIIGHTDLFRRPVRNYKSLLHPELKISADVPTLRELLVQAISDIFQAPLDIDDDLQKIRGRTRGRNVQLTSIGPARMSGLEHALKPSKVHRWGSRTLRSQTPTISPRDNGDSIAVVGMAGKFPGAQNVDELWKILVEGRDLHQMIPIDRFDVRTHVDPTGKIKNTSLTPYGCFDEHVGEFDVSLFKMSPREAAQTDPMQRMMLLTAYEALESAGYYDNGDPVGRPRNGTFYGVGGDDYRQANSGQDVDTNYITGGTRAFGPGRVSYYFGWEGPSMCVDTACSASAMAMHQAISSLKLRECDVALAGGANLLTCSDMFAGLSRAKFVCSTGPCKTLDETADGYCRADAAATVVFKRFNDAIRDKDNILGIIRSMETNHAGMAISLTHPEAETQTALFESVLTSAGMGVDDIDHVEMHGTGTQAGDLAETTSVVQLLQGPRPKDRPLTISSVKPNVGHSEAASGVTSLIKGLLMLQNQTIPQHIGIKTRLNPKLPPLGDFNIVVPRTNMPYPALSKDSTRRMLVNNFNATGGITAMLLEEYQPSPVLHQDIRRHYPITLSTASAKTLIQGLTRLLQYLKSNVDIEVSHLSYTLTARRLHHKHRFACVASTTEELIEKIQAEVATSKQAPQRGLPPFTVLLFTGQGSSYSGMANGLFQTNTAFRSHLIRSDTMCRDMGLPSFIEVITNGETDLSRFGPTQSQLALVAIEIALASLFESWGVRPCAVVGHSLGEYSALCVSQVLSLGDTLYLVGKRGLLLESACKSYDYAMAAVSLPVSELENVLRLSRFSRCEIACLNSPSQAVVSGPDADIELLKAHLAAEKVRVTKLRTPYGFHSKQMDVILSEYSRITENVPFKKPAVPFASTLLGEIVLEEGTINARYLCRQTREPVRFQDALHKLEGLLEDGQKALWMEVGPAPSCLPMIASSLRAKPAYLVSALDSKKSNWLTISDAVTRYYSSNGNVRWDEYHKEYLSALSLLQLPSYPFDLKKYWIQYEGDWIIRKNQGVSVPASATPTPAPTLESSTLHALENDLVENGIRKLSFSSNFGAGELRSMVEGHEVEGQPSCPGSVYVDMALAATSYLCKTSERGPKSPAMEVSALEICSDSNLPALQAATIVAIQRPSETSTVEVAVTSENEGEVVELARCKVIIGDGVDWKADANGNAYLYQSRMDLLNLFLANGQAVGLSQLEAYQRLSRVVAYDQTFQGIQEVLLNCGAAEATANIRLSRTEGAYVCDPRWLDTLVQLPSIVVNYGPASALGARLTFRGWNKMHVLLPLEHGIDYRVHVRMQPYGQSGSIVGDLHVFDAADHAALVIKQIQFRPMPASNVNTALPSGAESPQITLINGGSNGTMASGSETPNFSKVNGSRTPRFSEVNGSHTPNFSRGNGTRTPEISKVGSRTPETSKVSNNQTSSFSRPNGNLTPDPSQANGNGCYTPLKSPVRPYRTGEGTKGTINGGLLSGLLKESPELNNIANGGVSDDLPISAPAPPKPAPEHQRDLPVSTSDAKATIGFSEILAVMAAEIGVELDSLTDDMLLEELGVDSIIQLSLVARIEECLARPLPPGFLAQFDSIAQLRQGFAAVPTC